MFNLGMPEMLLIFVFPFSGFLAAIYLTVTLRSNAQRTQQPR
jgi:hypothetical protein